MMLKTLILLVLGAAVAAFAAAALAQNTMFGPPAAAPRQAPSCAESQPMAEQDDVGAEEAWALELGYVLVPDSDWNRGPWEEGGFALVPARPDALSDQWWRRAPSNGDEGRYVYRGGDPGAIPGPQVGLEPPGRPDQFSGQAWGYIGDEEGAVGPQSARPGRYSYDNIRSDMHRYDDQKTFVDWWDSGLIGRAR